MAVAGAGGSTTGSVRDLKTAQHDAVAAESAAHQADQAVAQAKTPEQHQQAVQQQQKADADAKKATAHLNEQKQALYAQLHTSDTIAPSVRSSLGIDQSSPSEHVGHDDPWSSSATDASVDDLVKLLLQVFPDAGSAAAAPAAGGAAATPAAGSAAAAPAAGSAVAAPAAGASANSALPQPLAVNDAAQPPANAAQSQSFASVAGMISQNPANPSDFDAFAAAHQVGASNKDPAGAMGKAGQELPSSVVRGSKAAPADPTAVEQNLQQQGVVVVPSTTQGNTTLYDPKTRTFSTFDAAGKSVLPPNPPTAPVTGMGQQTDSSGTVDGTKARTGFAKDGDGNLYGVAYQDGTNVVASTPFQIKGQAAQQRPDGLYQAAGDVMDASSDATPARSAIVYPNYDASKNNPGFPSGTPVPGGGANEAATADIDKLPADSDLAKYVLGATPAAGSNDPSRSDYTSASQASNKGSGSTSAMATKDGIRPVAVDGGKSLLVYEPTGAVRLFDAQTGKEQTSGLPPSMTGSPPAHGTMIFGDGTRVDAKGTDGATIISGNDLVQMSTKGDVTKTTDPAAVQQYMGANAANPVNLGVQGADGWRYTNNLTADGKQAWQKVGGSRWGGDDDVSVSSVMNDPNTSVANGSLSLAQSYAMNPGFAGYVPPSTGTDAESTAHDSQQGWTAGNLGDPPLTQSQFNHDVVPGVVLGTVFSGLFDAPIGALFSGIVKAGTSLLGRVARSADEAPLLRSARPAGDPPSPSPSSSQSQSPSPSASTAPSTAPSSPSPSASTAPSTAPPKSPSPAPSSPAAADPAAAPSTSAPAASRASDAPTAAAPAARASAGEDAIKDLYGPSGEPQFTDGLQGNVPDCWLITFGNSLAKMFPKKLAKIFRTKEDGTVDVTLHDSSDPSKTYVYNIKKSDYLADGASDRSRAEWVPVLEAAVKKFLVEHPASLGGKDKLTISDITQGGNSNLASRILLGVRSKRLNPSNAGMSDDTIAMALNANKVTTAGTRADDVLPAGTKLSSTHAYMVVGASKDASGQWTVTLRDPHALMPVKVSMQEFRESFMTLEQMD